MFLCGGGVSVDRWVALCSVPCLSSCSRAWPVGLVTDRTCGNTLVGVPTFLLTVWELNHQAVGHTNGHLEPRLGTVFLNHYTTLLLRGSRTVAQGIFF